MPVRSSTLSLPGELQIPILYRDFLYAGTTTPGPGHPDFEAFYGDGATGIVASTLGAGRRKAGLRVFAGIGRRARRRSSPGITTRSSEARRILTRSSSTSTRTTTRPCSRSVSNPAGSYSFSSSFFYPIDDLGWNAGGNPQVSVADDGSSTTFPSRASFDTSSRIRAAKC